MWNLKFVTWDAIQFSSSKSFFFASLYSSLWQLRWSDTLDEHVMQVRAVVDCDMVMGSSCCQTHGGLEKESFAHTYICACAMRTIYFTVRFCIARLYTHTVSSVAWHHTWKEWAKQRFVPGSLVYEGTHLLSRRSNFFKKINRIHSHHSVAAALPQISLNTGQLITLTLFFMLLCCIAEELKLVSEPTCSSWFLPYKRRICCLMFGFRVARLYAVMVGVVEVKLGVGVVMEEYFVQSG